MEAAAAGPAVFEALVRSEPEVGHYVELRIRRTSCAISCANTPLSLTFPPRACGCCWKGWSPDRSAPESWRSAKASRPGAMFIVRDGRLRAYIDRDGTREQRSYLRRGDFFGEVSLLRGTDRTANVEAVSDCELWALEPQLFAQLVAEHPKFRERIEQRISAYDYRRTANVPLDFADELLPADAAGPEILSAEQTQVAGAALPRTTMASTSKSSISVDSPARAAHPPLSRDDCRTMRRTRAQRRWRWSAAITAARCQPRVCARPFIPRLMVRACSVSDRVRSRSVFQGARREGVQESAGLDAAAGDFALGEQPLAGPVRRRHRVRWVADPARGRRRIRAIRTRGELVWLRGLVRPHRSVQGEYRRNVPRVGWFLGFFKPYRRTLLIAVALAFLSAAGTMLIPVLSKFIVDEVIRQHDVGCSPCSCWPCSARCCCPWWSRMVQRQLLSRIAVRVDRETLDTLAEVLLALPMSYFQARRMGDIGRRLSGLQSAREISR